MENSPKQIRRSRWYARLPILKKLLNNSQEEILSLRADFQSRYQAFQLLIDKNNQALEILSAIEAATCCEDPVGMSFLRTNCGKAKNLVHDIIICLEKISFKEYADLFCRYEEICREIDSILTRKHTQAENPLVYPLDRIDRTFASYVGGKMAHLGELKNRLDLKVPSGFAISADAYHAFMSYNKLQPEIDRLIDNSGQDNIQQLYQLSQGIIQFIEGAQVPETLRDEIVSHYRVLEKELGKGTLVAMRSSALGEDGPEMSFAGQYRTIFNLTEQSLILAYKKVVASKYHIQAMMYRLMHGIKDEDVAMCVGCMPQMFARSGGVAYSRNPLKLSGRNDIIIHSVLGHPIAVVDGSTISDSFLFKRDATLSLCEKHIAKKEWAYTYCDKDGLKQLPLSLKDSARASLSDEEAYRIAELTLKIEEHYGIPQDVEWVIDPDGSLIILQTRPLKIGVDSSSVQSELEPAGLDSFLISEGGITASPGAASGPVHLIENKSAALSFQSGGIIVASQASPYLAMLLNKASGLITERGSILGHLANVAREFDIPAIFGLENITKLLKEGQIITVDADAKKIYRERISGLLNRTKQRQSKFVGSPIHQTLKSLAALIVPLTLLDPDASNFSPQGCQTLHDIIRFCHEKSVKELFNFGKNQRIKRRVSKQLHAGVPMQFWVIDLKDGFIGDLGGQRYVCLEEIVSIPMLALWRGMSSIEWSGPPPVDGGGLLSIMVNSTSNTALDPSMPSVYSTPNYFMITKNFCSLQSRFGYHYSSVEAIVGDQVDENYIIFQFKGGAADTKRKNARAQLVAETLEQNGFRINLVQDSLTARIEHYERKEMEIKLEVIGYLTIHTRQLDMVLGDQYIVSQYRNKIEEDLAILLSNHTR